MNLTDSGRERHTAARARNAVRLILALTGGYMFVARSDTAEAQARSFRQQPPSLSPIVELRQYTLHPSRRDAFIDLFDREFIETQEAAGMRVIGQFRDLDEPARFVWLRGFSDMSSRTTALSAFYGGPHWKALRESANASIIDNDNVLLLHPARPQTGFVFESDIRPAPGAPNDGKGFVTATVYHVDAAKEAGFVDFFEATVVPELKRAGIPVLAEFASEHSENTFPRLPVREGEHVFVWFSRFSSAAAYERCRADLAHSASWRDSISAELTSRIREPQVLRLSPTSRSLLHD